MNKTKIICFINEEIGALSIKLNKPGKNVCLKDLKQKLEQFNINTNDFVFHFNYKNINGLQLPQVINNDSCILPSIHGIVLSWLVLRQDVDSEIVTVNHVNQSK
jgi:hypothetical protein